MKTTDEAISKISDEKLQDTIKTQGLSNTIARTTARTTSIRPQKSMMRIKSCRPQKLKFGRRLIAKSIIVAK